MATTNLAKIPYLNYKYDKNLISLPLVLGPHDYEDYRSAFFRQQHTNIRETKTEIP